MSRLCVLFALLAIAAARPSSVHNKTVGICENDYCQCSNVIHPAWTSIDCAFPKDAVLNLFYMDLPSTLMEFTITGGEALMFGPGAFNNVADLRRIDISEFKTILFRSYTAVDLSVLNLYINIDSCDLLRFESHSFQNLKGPLLLNITECQMVSVEGETFSWLLSFEISNVRELVLGGEAFKLDPTAANVGDHGPGMTIGLRNTTVSEFPKSAFGSSAAKVYLERVEIHAIRTGAFSANTYNIVLAINCSIHLIEEEAFSEKSLINYLNLEGCKIQQLKNRAFRSAIADINIIRNRFHSVQTGAINTTVATVKILNNEFHAFMDNGFELSSWNNLQMENNSFDDLPPNAIVAPAASIHKLTFSNNEIETMHAESLSFIGRAATREIIYLNNYFGQSCHCNISRWLSQALEVDDSEDFEAHSYCTVNEVLARCFNVPDQNMLIKKFLKEVCNRKNSIQCEKTKTKISELEIKNPRFPHKYKDDELSPRNKKVIGIVVVSCIGCVTIAILFTFFKWLRRGHCRWTNIKDVFISFNTGCTSICRRMCTCGSNVGIDNARSISQLSVNEYSERHRLNESRAQDIVQESTFHDVLVVPTEEKFTQTLPEELTKELLDNLKERLDNPENYVEAREMIEHLYELTKITDEAPQIAAMVNVSNADENVYEIPFPNNTTRRLRNRQMKSVGTRTPSLDKLMPLSPYYFNTPLSHEYFEPLDLAVHLYAEIANNDKGKRSMLGVMPDVIAEQAIPRGPYLRAVLVPNNTPIKKSSSSGMGQQSASSIKSNSSNSSTKMKNRPLPEKPQVELSRIDPGEGTSVKLG